MNFTEEKIKNIVAETVEINGFFLIDLIFRGNANNRIIEIYIDKENDVSADDCALISREIDSRLEELIETSYRLDVSSPGVDRPLKFLKQFPKHLNRKFEVSYSNSAGETKKLVGKLTAAEGDTLTFLPANKEEININFNNIKKAKVIVSFS